MIYLKVIYLSTGANFEGLSADVGVDGTLHPGGDLDLGVGDLGAEVVVGVSEGLADGVDTDVVAGVEEVSVHEHALASGVNLGPLAVHVFGEEVLGGELLLFGGAALEGTGHVSGVQDGGVGDGGALHGTVVLFGGNGGSSGGNLGDGEGGGLAGINSGVLVTLLEKN